VGFIYDSFTFQNFDPISGEISSSQFSDYLKEIARRARANLTGRSKQEIVNAGDVIGWMIDVYLTEFEADRVVGEMRSRVKQIEILKEFVEKYDIKTYQGFEDGTKFEYFAVFALCKVAEANFWAEHDNLLDPGEMSKNIETIPAAYHKYFVNNKEGKFLYSGNRIDTDKATIEALHFRIAGDIAIDAMEAVCLSEHYCEMLAANSQVDMKIEEGVKRKIVLNTTKGAKARHAENYRFKQEALDMFRNGKFKSNEEAARLISRQIPYSPRTIAKWISEAKKNKLFQQIEHVLG